MKHKNSKKLTLEKYAINQKLYDFCKNGVTTHKIYKV